MNADLYLDIAMVPVGKARARSVPGRRPYTPKPTRAAEKQIATEWMVAGRVRLPDGPIDLWVTATMPRPARHYRKDGSLSAEGCRHARPTGKPDLDNVVKLIADALNGLAWRDDAQIVSLHAMRVYGPSGRLQVIARSLNHLSPPPPGPSTGPGPPGA